MKVGDKITFPFGKGEKEGVVVRMHQKSVVLSVDFPKHPGKVIRRKIHDLEGAEKGKKPRKKEK